MSRKIGLPRGTIERQWNINVFITPTPQTEIGALPFGSLGSNAPFQGDGNQQAFDAGCSDHMSQTTYVAFWHLADIDADDEHVCFGG